MEIKNIGWIGTGVMGSSMASFIQKAGYKLYVYNRTKEKANTLIENGAIWCSSPAEVAKNSDVIFSIVGFPKDVEETFLNEKMVF